MNIDVSLLLSMFTHFVLHTQIMYVQTYISTIYILVFYCVASVLIMSCAFLSYQLCNFVHPHTFVLRTAICDVFAHYHTYIHLLFANTFYFLPTKATSTFRLRNKSNAIHNIL